MNRYLVAFRRLALWQKAVVAVMLLVVLATWFAVCLILAGVIGP